MPVAAAPLALQDGKCVRVRVCVTAVLKSWRRATVVGDYPALRQFE